MTTFLADFLKQFSIYLHFLPVGTPLQSVAGDTEAGTDVWSVQSQAEAECFGQGQNGLWPI